MLDRNSFTFDYSTITTEACLAIISFEPITTDALFTFEPDYSARTITFTIVQTEIEQGDNLVSFDFEASFQSGSSVSSD